MMNELDRHMKQALKQVDADMPEYVDTELSMLEQVMETFRGRNRWLNVFGVIYSLLFMVFGVYCAVHFFRAEEIREQMWWGAGLIISLQIITAIKVWYWMDLIRNSTSRELKRIELQVARLAERLNPSEPAERS